MTELLEDLSPEARDWLVSIGLGLLMAAVVAVIVTTLGI